MSYHIGSQGIVAIPIYIRHMLALKETTTGSGRLDITVGPKQTLGRTVSIHILYIKKTHSICTFKIQFLT